MLCYREVTAAGPGHGHIRSTALGPGRQSLQRKEIRVLEQSIHMTADIGQGYRAILRKRRERRVERGVEVESECWR